MAEAESRSFSTESCKFLTETIMNIQNFNLFCSTISRNGVSSQRGDFQPKILYCWKKISDGLKFQVEQLPPALTSVTMSLEKRWGRGLTPVVFN